MHASRGTPHTLYAPYTQGCGNWAVTPPPPKNLPTLEDHLRAKCHPNLSGGLDFYTHTQTNIAFY